MRQELPVQASFVPDEQQLDRADEYNHKNSLLRCPTAGSAKVPRECQPHVTLILLFSKPYDGMLAPKIVLANPLVGARHLHLAD